MMIKLAMTMVSAVMLAGAAQALTFSDGLFLDANWSSTQLTLGGAQPSDPTATFTAGQVTSGGFPGAYREVTHTYQGPLLAIGVAHLQAGAVYDPGVSGAIASLGFSFDLNFFNYPGTQPGASYAVGYNALLRQDGFYYVGPQALTVSSAWTSHNFVATAADFHRLNGIATPDFSAGGGAIQIGYATFNGTAGAERTSTTSGIDNWNVAVTASPAPEPASWMLMIGGFGAIGATLRRRSHQIASAG